MFGVLNKTPILLFFFMTLVKSIHVGIEYCIKIFPARYCNLQSRFDKVLHCDLELLQKRKVITRSLPHPLFLLQPSFVIVVIQSKGNVKNIAYRLVPCKKIS